MAATQRLRVGVIGCGAIAQMMHLPFLRSLPARFEIAALCDVSPGVLRAVGALYGVPPERQFADFRDLTGHELDAVLVLSGGSHAPQVLAAIDAGKHVLVEKPLCTTLREADEIAAAAERAGVTVMVAYMKRYDPGYRTARRLLAGMTDVRYVQINSLNPSEDEYIGIHGVLRFDDLTPEQIAAFDAAEMGLLDEAVGAGVARNLKKAYGNIMLGSMVHDVNALRGLLGEPDRVLSTDIWPTTEKAPSITTTLTYGERTRVVYTWSALEHLRDYFEEIALLSPGNRLRIQFPSPYLDHFPTPIVFQGMEDGAMVERRIIASYDEAFRQELLAFHDCVVEGKTPLTSVADARQDIALLQRIFATFRPDGLGGEAARDSA